ncbi:hypothetical protein AYO40_00290 [Planctomycetaceae bacterium SCGC AG-212-D15]|nr:hypothetical protein AYO40_00290 [Planctomycetaceae bacterium SCGC AG-212-D15]
MSAAKEIIDRIKVLTGNLKRQEGDLLKIHLELAKQIAELKRLNPKRYHHKLTHLGYGERMIRRYAAIGESIFVQRPQDTELLGKLPAELIKLEAMAALSPEQFQQITAEGFDFKKEEREDVARKVQETLGKKPKKAAPELSVERMEKTLAAFVDKQFTDVRKLAPKLTPEQRLALSQQIETALEELLEALLDDGQAAPITVDTVPQPSSSADIVCHSDPQEAVANPRTDGAATSAVSPLTPAGARIHAQRAKVRHPLASSIA